jgi:hypothetical protein
MSATAANTIDACQAHLHAKGFSIGDMAVRSTRGTMWAVFAHRGNERLVARARTQSAAWREAVRIARSTNGVGNGRIQ